MHSVFLPQIGGHTQAGKVVVVAAPKAPIPFENWPLWAKALSLLRKSEDVGIGDTVRRTIGDANSKKFQTWYRNTFGKSCGCAKRHAEWSQGYRY